MSVPERPEIDFLILADRAEGVKGKLYVMGGGWDRLGLLDFSQPTPFSLAVGVLVPWNATNEDHPLRIWIENEDGTQEIASLNVTVNMGRPPTAIQGQSFRAIIAVTGLWKFPGPGTYCAVARLHHGDARRAVFYVHHAATSAPASPPATG